MGWWDDFFWGSIVVAEVFISSLGLTILFGLIGAGYTSSSMKYKFTGGANTYTSNAIDISITPNRGDCLGVNGLARELNASGIGKLKKKSP
mgnify:CR=1 FL=1